MTVVRNILRSVERASISSSNDSLNILTIFQGNEKYVSLLANNITHKFYLLSDQSWNASVTLQPTNVYSLTQCSEPLDYILCFNRAEQYDQAQSLSNQLHLPIILVDLCSSTLIRPQHLAETIQVKNMDLLNKKPCYKISCSEYIRDSWKQNDESIVIPIGIDTDKYNNHISKQQLLVALDNNIPAEIGSMVHMQIRPPYQLIPTDHNNHNDISVNKAKYFINPFKTLTIKTLEAMSAGALVIAFRTPDLEKIITHQSTGILINSLDEIPQVLELLENNTELYNEITTNARNEIISNHSLDTFTGQWNQVFETIRPLFYTPHI